ncbi:MAG: hypothetical protein MPW16_11330 [Candidatus Manganitrophus sp.]|nr:MAG: hypothetical protein MPW16_11330 [Candidatus Manganitrophus sp.]
MNFSAALRVPPFGVSPWRDHAISDEARHVCKLINDASEFTGSVTVGEPKRAILKALISTYRSAQVDGWDGSDARKVEPSTFMYADQFLRLLPSSLSLPEITADSDGEIFIEWDHGHRQVFSVSVGRDGTLNFAGLFGHEKVHGTEYLREALPPLISAGLERFHKTEAA